MYDKIKTFILFVAISGQAFAEHRFHGDFYKNNYHYPQYRMHNRSFHRNHYPRYFYVPNYSYTNSYFITPSNYAPTISYEYPEVSEATEDNLLDPKIVTEAKTLDKEKLNKILSLYPKCTLIIKRKQGEKLPPAVILLLER